MKMAKNEKKDVAKKSSHHFFNSNRPIGTYPESGSAENSVLAGNRKQAGNRM